MPRLSWMYRIRFWNPASFRSLGTGRFPVDLPIPTRAAFPRQSSRCYNVMVSDKPPEDLLAMARRHVVEGELRVTRQEACIAKLTRDGHHAAAARGTEVLKQMRWSLDLGRRHLAFELAQQSRRQSANSSPLLCRRGRVTNLS
jgi:hypothetical protein